MVAKESQTRQKQWYATLRLRIWNRDAEGESGGGVIGLNIVEAEMEALWWKKLEATNSKAYYEFLRSWKRVEKESLVWKSIT